MNWFEKQTKKKNIINLEKKTRLLHCIILHSYQLKPVYTQFNLELNFVAAGELGNAVQDAFVIAVEQQARERLQRLSALKRITPVDMSQLSIKVWILFLI